jgi:hypothetical protein
MASGNASVSFSLHMPEETLRPALKLALAFANISEEMAGRAMSGSRLIPALRAARRWSGL